jgi:hypothetical protein
MTDTTFTGASRIYTKGYRRGWVAGAAALLAAIEKAPTSAPPAIDPPQAIVDPTTCTECDDPFCDGCERSTS